ncbi:MAG: PilZ domain-containing protein [Desulfobulbaceae bacterium]|nr:PilZ domain-containing protein [Desulfobulbaceae bacterium]
MIDSTENIAGDKRLHERLRKSYRVTYRRMEDLSSPSPAREGVVIDVSGGGFCFLAGEPFEENSRLALLVEFPGWLADEHGDWIVTHDEKDVARLEVLVVVTRFAASRTVPGRFEIGVRICGRIG